MTRHAFDDYTVAEARAQGRRDRHAGLAIQAWGDWRDDDPDLVGAYLDGYDDPRGVDILRDPDWNEFQVPTPTADAPDSVYHTDNREDALDTARAHHGDGVTIRIIRKRFEA